MRNPTPLLWTLALALTLFGVSGCDGSEATLEEASQKVERVARDVDTARSLVEQREQELAKAMEGLEEAREELAVVETKLSEARQSVEEAVSDNELFRAVQSALLEDDDLEAHAIAARVAQRVVTLEGTVPSEDLKARAEKIAGGALGVATVVNQIRVETPPAEG